MTVTSTSKQAFIKYKKRSLGRKQIQVHNALKRLGRATDLEIATFLKEEINEVTPRRNELVKYGYVREDGRKINRTGNSAKAWVPYEPLTDKLIRMFSGGEVNDCE